MIHGRINLRIQNDKFAQFLEIIILIMDSPKHIQTEHKDIIHDVSFDYYGKRMATCSSDHTVKVSKQNK